MAEQRKLAPPPAYLPRTATKHLPTLVTLPDHLLLSILACLTLPDLAFNVRATTRKLYLFATHLLRRQLLPVWESKVHPGYTTDAGGLFRFNSYSVPSSPNDPSPLSLRSRETVIFDLFISACAYEANKSFESSLNLLPSASHSASHDLFEFLQPRARIEDLVIRFGRQDKLIYAEGDSGVSRGGGGGTILSEDVSVQLTPRSGRVMLPFASSNVKGAVVLKAVVEVKRDAGERLETTAEKIVDGLAGVRVWREEGRGADGKCVSWYARG
jgi:hypothetical protein